MFSQQIVDLSMSPTEAMILTTLTVTIGFVGD